MKKFLESEISDLPVEQCLFHVIPAPLEATVSYGTGTVNGPEAILKASDHLEAFDGISCPCKQGIHTTETALTLEEIEHAVSMVWEKGKFPVVLGGEHTVTLGALRALCAAGETFGIVQFDAHADLRNEYENSKLSHACVMRRAVDDLGLPLFQIGVRALSVEESQIRNDRDIDQLDAVEIAKDGIPDIILPAEFPQKVYITFDVDGLDPSAMPSTGTPVPNGLTWREAFQCLEKISEEREIIAMDVVELAPIEGIHAPDFGVAQLIYNVMGLVSRDSQYYINFPIERGII